MFQATQYVLHVGAQSWLEPFTELCMGAIREMRTAIFKGTVPAPV